MTWADYWKIVFCWPQEGVPQPFGLTYWYPFWAVFELWMIAGNLTAVAFHYGLHGAVSFVHLGLLLAAAANYGITRWLYVLRREGKL